LSLIAARDPASALLVQLTKDKDYLVRTAAIGSIAELRDLKMAGAVEAALEDPVPEVVFAAARALYQMKAPQGKRMLIEIIEKDTKANSGFIRSKLRDTWRHMETPKSALFFAVQQGAGFVPVPGFGEGISAMSEIMGDPKFSARATALISLAADRTPEVRGLVEEAFRDEDWSMRAAAVQIAAMRRERAWLPRLVPLLDDTNRKVRFRAAASYLRLS
jgi:HEAT repeat protein